MSDLKPWSEGLTVRWAPSVEFLEHRFALLRALQDSGAMRQFGVGGEIILVRVSRSRALEVAIDHLSFEDAYGELAEGEQFATVLRLVDEHVRPHVLGLQWSFQYLIALEGFRNAQEACVSAARAVHGPLGDALGMVDFAALVDGEVEGLGTYKMEFGVLPDDEAPLRLSRMIGRAITPSVDREMVLEANAGREFPSTGLFLDIAWSVKVQSPGADQSVSGILDVEHALVSESSRMAQAIYDRIVTDGARGLT